jgi:hypothetical protein
MFNKVLSLTIRKFGYTPGTRPFAAEILNQSSLGSLLDISVIGIVKYLEREGHAISCQDSTGFLISVHN